VTLSQTVAGVLYRNNVLLKMLKCLVSAVRSYIHIGPKIHLINKFHSVIVPHSNLFTFDIIVNSGKYTYE